MKLRFQRVGDPVCVALLCGLALWLRPDKLSAPEKFLPDALVGIAYGADLLRDGLTPMIDSMELDPPGAALLTHILWSFSGRSLEALYRFAPLWSLLTALGVFVVGRLIWGRMSGLVAAASYLLAAPVFTQSVTGSIMGHEAWMMAPWVWSAVPFVLGLRDLGVGDCQSTSREPADPKPVGHPAVWLLLSGACVAVAALIRYQAVLLLLGYVLVLIAGPKQLLAGGWHDGLANRIMPLLLGFVLVFAGMIAYYLARGGLAGVAAFVSQYFTPSPDLFQFSPLASSWSQYSDWLKDGARALWGFAALPTLLASACLLGLSHGRQTWTWAGLLLWIHDLPAILGLFYHFNFTPAGFLPLLPAIAWLIGHPQGPVLRWFQGSQYSLVGRLSQLTLLSGVLALTLPAYIVQSSAVENLARRQKAKARAQRAAHLVASYVRGHSAAWDGIWVWGPAAWPVYYLAQRRSALDYYRSQRFSTTLPIKTWRRQDRATFTRRPVTRKLAQQLKTRRPAFIVLSSRQAYRGFHELKRLLKRSYRRVELPSVAPLALYQKKPQMTAGNGPEMSRRGEEPIGSLVWLCPVARSIGIGLVRAMWLFRSCPI